MYIVLSGHQSLPGEFGSRVRARVSGRTMSDGRRERAASARVGLKNLMTAYEMAKAVLTSGVPRY
jgi:hypothetical protein